MKRTFLFILIMAAYCFAASGTTFADTYKIEVQNIGDGYYNWYSGPGGDYFTDNSNFIFADYTSSYLGSNERTGYTQYSLAGAPDPSLIDSITLNINLEAKDPYCYGWIRYLPNAATANGHASQRLDGTQAVGTISTSSPIGWVSFDVTDLIKTDLENGLSWAPFSFHGTHSNYAGYRFSSAESGNASYLEFNYTPVPIPGALWLLGSGLVGLVGLRKRQESVDE